MKNQKFMTATVLAVLVVSIVLAPVTGAEAAPPPETQVYTYLEDIFEYDFDGTVPESDFVLHGGDDSMPLETINDAADSRSEEEWITDDLMTCVSKVTVKTEENGDTVYTREDTEYYDISDMPDTSAKRQAEDKARVAFKKSGLRTAAVSNIFNVRWYIKKSNQSKVVAKVTCEKSLRTGKGVECTIRQITKVGANGKWITVFRFAGKKTSVKDLKKILEETDLDEVDVPDTEMPDIEW